MPLFGNVQEARLVGIGDSGRSCGLPGGAVFDVRRSGWLVAGDAVKGPLADCRQGCPGSGGGEESLFRFLLRLGMCQVTTAAMAKAAKNRASVDPMFLSTLTYACPA